jgi:predicted phosphodiesterase
MPKKTDKDFLADAMEENRKQQTKIVVLEHAAKKFHKAELTTAMVREDLYKLAAMVPSPPKWINKPHRIGRHYQEVPVTIWSDFHWFEVVRNCGGNVFNKTIAAVRLRRLVDSTIDLCFHHMVKPEYPGIVICLGGDMITGDIHDELLETNDGTVQEALLDIQENLIAALTKMADNFGKVFLPCVVGNHARDTHRPRFKDATFHSYEWNLYHQLKMYFRADPRFEFFIPDEVDASFTVLGHRFLLTHGDNLGVQGGDGIIGAIGPIARGAFKLGRQMRQAKRDFDTLLIGHYHTYMPRGDAIPVVANGSLIGFNEYANLKLRAPNSRPLQALFMIHPKRGFTCSWPVYLEDEPTEKTENRKWVEVFK